MTEKSDFLDGMPPTPIGSDPRHKSGSIVDKVEDGFAGGVSDLKDSVSVAAIEAGGAATEAAAETTGLADHALDKAKAVADDVGETLARSAHQAAGAINKASQRAAGAVRDAAQRVGHLSDSLPEWDVGDVKTSANDFIMKRPLVSAAIGVAAGFILGRMLGASNRHG